MNQSFALRLILSCYIVWNAVFGGLWERSTTGGRDKRRGALRRYSAVVIRFFACCGHGRSAATATKTLSHNVFCRASPVYRDAIA